MGIQPITEAELDYGYSQGFLEKWLEDAPAQVTEHLAILVGGISAYREKYTSIQTDYADLQRRYNDLMAVSAQHLEFMRQQREQLDAALLEQQKPSHERDTIET